MMISIQNLVSFCQFVLKTLSKNQNLTSIKGRNPFANLGKIVIYITDVDLVNDKSIQNLVPVCQFVLKLLSKNKILKCIKGNNRILTSIKVSNSVANLQKKQDLKYQHRSCQ